MKTYAMVGTGYRGQLSYLKPITEDFADCAKLVAVCDTNLTRAKGVSAFLGQEIPAYTDFEAMMSDHHPDTVIVTTVDQYHEKYTVRALELGSDVISEKPITTTPEMLRSILDAEKRTGHKVRVTFNDRFHPFYSRIRELIQNGILGEIYSVHFEWLLDTSHGADYFRRWHSIRENSGSLLIHKATHHFDLVNWFIGEDPVKVNAFGTRRYYGDDRREHGDRCLTCPKKDSCEFYMDINEDPDLRRIYLECEKDDGYIRDRCVFSDVIDIEDTVSLNVQYSGGCVMSYSLTAHSPYEAMKIVLNGKNGRLEAENIRSCGTIRFYNRLGECVSIDRSNVDTKKLAGGHGGSDPALRKNLFRGCTSDPLGQMAGTRAGAMSVAIGMAANKSMAEDRAVEISEFLGEQYPELYRK